MYLAAFTERRRIMAESSAKRDRIGQLADAVNEAERSIVFAQTVAAADAAIQCLKGKGHSGAVIEASMDAEERLDVFSAFERGDYAVVAAPKLLDEGVDVPAADLAIVLATSRSRRQLIQRMGRVIRKKVDGRAARIVVLYAEGTAEDPEKGAHEDFLEEVLEVADEVALFPAIADPRAIVAYLSPTRPLTQRTAPSSEVGGSVLQRLSGPDREPQPLSALLAVDASTGVRGRIVRLQRRRSANGRAERVIHICTPDDLEIEIRIEDRVAQEMRTRPAIVSLRVGDDLVVDGRTGHDRDFLFVTLMSADQVRPLHSAEPNMGSAEPIAAWPDVRVARPDPNDLVGRSILDFDLPNAGPG